MKDVATFPIKHSDLEYVNAGASSFVFKLDEGSVIKIFHDESIITQYPVELEIYERIGEHPSIIKLLYPHQRGLVFERMKDHIGRHLLECRESQQTPSQENILKWAFQLADGIQHIHSRSVLQIDISCGNLLLDWDDNLRICDFAGSSIDGSEPTIAAGTRFQFPKENSKVPTTIEHEVFAMGSTLYQISTTRQPFEDKEDSEVEKLYAADIFPNTDGLVLGDVIQKCWRRQYKDAGECKAAIATIRASKSKGPIARAIPSIPWTWPSAGILLTGMVLSVYLLKKYRILELRRK